MSKAWFVVRGANRFGPYSDQLLASLAATGRLAPNDRVWCEGLAEPLRAADLPGLFRSASTLPPPLPPVAAEPFPAMVVEAPPTGSSTVGQGRRAGTGRRAAPRRSSDGLKVLAVVGGLGGLVVAALVVLLVREPSKEGQGGRAAARQVTGGEPGRAAEPTQPPPPAAAAPPARFDRQAALAEMARAAVAELIEGLPLGQEYDGELWESQLRERLVQGTRGLKDEAEIRGAARVICDSFGQETRAFVTRPPAKETTAPEMAAVDGDFSPERLLGMCREPFRGDTPLTEIAALPDNLCGMWWMHCKMGPGGVEIVPAETRRFASFMITSNAWQIANPGVSIAAQEFRGILRAPDVDGLPSYFVILSDDKQWVLHGPVEGRWILMRSFSDGKTEDGRSVFELKL